MGMYDMIRENKYKSQLKMLNKSRRKALFREIDKMGNPALYIVSGQSTSKQGDCDEVVLLAFHDKYIIVLRDIAEVPDENLGEIFSKIKIPSESLMDILDLRGLLQGKETIIREEPKRRYNERGAGRKGISEDIKVNVCKSLNEGVSVRKTAEKYGISTTTVQKIKKGI